MRNIILFIAMVLLSCNLKEPERKSFEQKVARVDSIVQSSDSSRNFLVSYYWGAKFSEKYSYGNITMYNYRYLPSENEMKDAVYCAMTPGYRSKERITIMGIYEFKSKKEYDSFLGDKERDLINCK